MKTRKKIPLLLVLALGGIFSSFAQHDLTGYWEDNYGMHYYVRHTNNTIYWFGEHRDGIWAGAFKGTISGNTREALFGNRPITIRGNVYDLPKGKGNTQADLGLRVVSGTEMRKTSGPFSPTIFRKKTKPRNLPGIRSAGFTSNGITGLWNSNNGGTYYMRQIGNKVIWYGEKASGSTTSFSNVAFGTRSGNTINLDWADVPKGRTSSNGRLQLRISGNTITKLSGNGSSTRWTKTGKKELDASVFNVILGGYTNRISVHLNNYDPVKGADRWFKPNDAYVDLPEEWGGKYTVDIPEIRHDGTFRNYYYYVQDLNSSRYGITAEVKPKSSMRFLRRSSGLVQKQPIIELAIRLETDGTEVKGRCGGKSDDKMAPDVHISKKQDVKFPIIYVYIPLIVANGKISYGEISTYFDANIQAGGICKIADRLCNKVTNYRETIITEVDKGFKDSFNSYDVKRNFENSLNTILPSEIRGNVSKLVMEGNNVVIEYN